MGKFVGCFKRVHEGAYLAFTIRSEVCSTGCESSEKIAREGKCRTQIRAEAAEHLAAAFFMVRYAKVLQERLAASG